MDSGFARSRSKSFSRDDRNRFKKEIKLVKYKFFLKYRKSNRKRTDCVRKIKPQKLNYKRRDRKQRRYRRYNKNEVCQPKKVLPTFIAYSNIGNFYWIDDEFHYASKNEWASLMSSRGFQRLTLEMNKEVIVQDVDDVTTNVINDKFMHMSISRLKGSGSNNAGDGPTIKNDGQTLPRNTDMYVVKTTPNGNCLLEAFTVFLESTETPNEMRNRFCEEMIMNSDCIILKDVFGINPETTLGQYIIEDQSRAQGRVVSVEEYVARMHGSTMYAGAIEQAWFSKQNNIKVDTYTRCSSSGLYEKLRSIDCCEDIELKKTIRLLYNATAYDNGNHYDLIRLPADYAMEISIIEAENSKIEHEEFLRTVLEGRRRQEEIDTAIAISSVSSISHASSDHMTQNNGIN